MDGHVQRDVSLQEQYSLMFQETSLTNTLDTTAVNSTEQQPARVGQVSPIERLPTMPGTTSASRSHTRSRTEIPHTLCEPLPPETTDCVSRALSVHRTPFPLRCSQTGVVGMAVTRNPYDSFRPLQGIVQIDQVAGRMVNSGELSPAIGTPMSQSPGMTPLSGGGLTPLGQNFNATPEYNEFEAAIQKVPVLDRCPATNELSAAGCSS